MGTLEALPRSFPTAAWRLPRPGPVDAVGLEARAGELASLSLEGETERQALDIALAAFELEAREAPALELCARALRPDPHDPGAGPVAAVSTAAARSRATAPTTLAPTRSWPGSITHRSWRAVTSPPTPPSPTCETPAGR
jgi:hypothetical protein